MPNPSRRALLFTPLAAPLLLSGCAWRYTASAPQTVEPLRFDHLTPMRLNVAVMDIEVQYVPGAADLGPKAPVPPVAALRRMAQDRLGAYGGSGRAVFAIRQASIIRARGAYDGVLAVRLDIQGQDGAALGFAEARVARRSTTDGDERTALNDITRQMMEAINVEFEFQVRRALKNFLVAGDPTAPLAPAPGAVERQDLTPPAGGPGGPPPR